MSKQMLELLRSILDEVEVDTEGKCSWSQVANILPRMRGELRSSADSAQPVAWRVDGIRKGKEQVWFYWKPEWPGLHEEQGDKVTPLYAKPPLTEPQSARCICQEQHRRGYCTEPGCPFSQSQAGSGKSEMRKVLDNIGKNAVSPEMRAALTRPERGEGG